jgi:Kef-type K+ transport system membrane component KefB
VSLALIALSAGGELHLSRLRERIRSISTITILQILFMFTFVAAAVYLSRGHIDFLRAEPPRVAVAVALLFGLVAVAKSPATTISVITEEKARGVLTDTVLGITVLKDVVILILIAMAAGFHVHNFSRQGRRLLHALEANSLPVYAVFFALAGADLDIAVLKTAWLVATAIILTRVFALWLSTDLGARLAHDPPVLRQHAWLGFMAQAGVTLGIANIIKERFPIWGVQVAAIILAMIAGNQLVGPPAFRWALIHAGESHVPVPGRGARL